MNKKEILEEKLKKIKELLEEVSEEEKGQEASQNIEEKPNRK